MAIRVYATSSDYETWTGVTPAPSDIGSALRAASLLVETEMLRTAVYDVDDDGLPTEEEVTDALRDAVCAQAQYTRSLGDAQGIGAGSVTGFSIGRLSVQRGGAAAGSQGSTGLPAHWSPQAWAILQAVSPTVLSWRGIWSW
jgi:hypothetical protein